MVEVICPNCGKEIEVKVISGRKPKNIPVIFICDKLQITRSVTRAAEELCCSRRYIYKVLKEAGMTVKEVIETKL